MLERLKINDSVYSHHNERTWPPRARRSLTDELSSFFAQQQSSMGKRNKLYQSLHVRRINWRLNCLSLCTIKDVIKCVAFTLCDHELIPCWIT